MEFAWLQPGLVKLIAAMPSWLGVPPTGWLSATAGAGAAALAIALVGVVRRRRLAAAARMRRVRGEAEVLKEELRLRLSEPAILFANGISVAPTMGASEAFEGDIEAAVRTVLQEAGGQRATAKELLERDPDNAGFRRDLSVTCDRIGDMHVQNGRLDAALECYRQSLEIAEALAKRDAQNPIWQHDLSVSHDRIGDILDKKGDRKAALESFRKGLAIAKALTLRDAD